MSLTALALIPALIASLLPLLLLALRDPKRLRAGAIARSPHTRRTRQALAAAALLPGAALIALGLWPALLIWLGAITVLGWLVVQSLAARP